MRLTTMTMEVGDTKNLDDDEIGQLIQQLVHLPDYELAASEQYSLLKAALQGKKVLNANNVFDRYSTDRRRALTLLFRLVDGTSVENLLLQRNRIDGTCLELSLRDFLEDEQCTKLSNIKKLDLAHNDFGGGGSLRTLGWQYTNVISQWEAEGRLGEKESENGSEWIAKTARQGVFPSLRGINMSGNTFSPKDVEALAIELAKFPSLESLLLRDMPHGTVSSFLSCPGENAILNGVQEIDLSANDLQGKGIEGFCSINWPQLRSLILRETGITVADCVAIADAIRAGKLKNLESIDLSRNKIGDDGMCILARSFCDEYLPQLREISFRRAGIGDKGAIALGEAIAGGLVHLESMQLSWNGIGDEGLIALAKSNFPGPLREISILANVYGDIGIRAIATAISEGYMQHLEKVHLTANDIVTDASVRALVTSLGTGQASHMKSLELSGMGLSSATVNELAKAITSGALKSLETLNLSNNGKVEDDSLAHLALALAKGYATNLRELYLVGLSWREDGICKLAAAIRCGKLQSLVALDLSSICGACRTDKAANDDARQQPPSERSMEGLAAAIGRAGQMTSLKRLLLSRTGLGSAGARKLARAIRSGSLASLEELDVSRCSKINYESATSLLAASRAPCAKRLKKLCVEGTGKERGYCYRFDDVAMEEEEMEEEEEEEWNHSDDVVWVELEDGDGDEWDPVWVDSVQEAMDVDGSGR